MERKKILFLSDHPLIPSGVGTQAKYLIEGLLATGKYRFVCLGGAVKHPNYQTQRVDPQKWGDDGWIIHPVDGYGDKQRVREILAKEKPDAMFIFTDPRFFIWVWEMEDEIRSRCPLLYWHVWDNDPTPTFNKVFYDSTDWIGTLSLKTYGLLQDLKLPSEKFDYIPHAVDASVFRPLPEEENQKFKKETFGPLAERKFVVFWNNRNARRKLSGDVVVSFAKFAEKVGKDNVALAMHTLIGDEEGQNIVEVAKRFGVEKNLLISQDRVPPETLNRFYNACDCTLNIASNEGFGLATLESLMSGTPIVVHMTGGLQFQVGPWWESLKDFSDQEKLFKAARSFDREKLFGSMVFPASRSCTGSQQLTYIYDDRPSHEDVVTGLLSLYNKTRAERREIGKRGSEWARKAFPMDAMVKSWDAALQEQLLKFATNPRPKYRLAEV